MSLAAAAYFALFPIVGDRIVETTKISLCDHAHTYVRTYILYVCDSLCTYVAQRLMAAIDIMHLKIFLKILICSITYVPLLVYLQVM